MGVGEWWWALLACGCLVSLLLAWRPVRHMLNEVYVERAREMFALQRPRLADQFLERAAATGKPRGLRWVRCELADQVCFARNHASHELHALVGITIAFEAIPGSDMEDVAAVGNLRNATAIFVFQGGQWHTQGRALFNMNPDEALRNFKDQYHHVEMRDA